MTANVNRPARKAHKEIRLIAKDGYGIVIGSFVAFLLSLGVNYFFPNPVAYYATLTLGFFSLFNLFFFRDPNRNVPRNKLAVISPADGKVTQIVSVDENNYLNAKVHRISIFLSVFNVHVNRSPISGTVDYFAYHPGRFLAAFKHEASEENEQTAIGLRDSAGNRVLFKQIAGLIARRIVCHLREGNATIAGDRMGLIRYGSRVDVFVPIGAKILVKEGQTVTGGQSILATFPDQGGETSQEETLVTLPKSEVSTED